MQLISVSEVRERMSKGEKLNLVDVREISEHDEFNIGGILMPLGKFQAMELDQLETLKDQELICYCRSGNRRSAGASHHYNPLAAQRLRRIYGQIEHGAAADLVQHLG